MQIERTKDEVVIRVSASIGAEELQRIVDYVAYKEATANSQATQTAVDKLAKRVKKNWWKKNRRKFIK